MSRLPDYDPTVIEVAARRLYEKATASLVVSIVVGASLGAAFGAVPLTPLGDAWPIPSSFGPATMLIGALAGAAIGYVVGDNRAFRHRLQAQAMLTGLQRELNTAATVDALREIVTRLSQEVESTRPHAEPAVAAPEIALPAHEPEPELEPEPAPVPVTSSPPVFMPVPPASTEPPAPVFALPEPALSPEPPAPEPTPEPEAFSFPEPTPEPEAYSSPEPALSPLTPEPELEPEPEPGLFALPEPEPEVFALPEPVVAEQFTFEPPPEATPEPTPEPNVFVLPDPVAFPAPEAPEGEFSPTGSPEFPPPLSADTF